MTKREIKEYLGHCIATLKAGGPQHVEAALAGLAWLSVHAGEDDPAQEADLVNGSGVGPEGKPMTDEQREVLQELVGRMDQRRCPIIQMLPGQELALIVFRQKETP